MTIEAIKKSFTDAVNSVSTAVQNALPACVVDTVSKILKFLSDNKILCGATGTGAAAAYAYKQGVTLASAKAAVSGINPLYLYAGVGLLGAAALVSVVSKLNVKSTGP